MLTRYFTPLEVTRYFERGEAKQDLLDRQAMAICSIADLLDTCEAYKKANLDISFTELHQKFNAFDKNLVREGFVSISNLDQYNLSAALFERDSGVVTDLWQPAANRGISPKQSLRCLTLRITDESVWWSENVYYEMEEYHISQDE